MVGNDPNYRKALENACKFAVHEINVLIVSKPGVGRYTFARLIYEIRHPGQPFYQADCWRMERFKMAEILGGSLMRFGEDFVRVDPDPKEMMHTLILKDVHGVSDCFAGDLAEFFGNGRLQTTDYGKVCALATAHAEKGATCHNQEGLEPFLRLFPAILKIPSLEQRRADVVPLAKAFLVAWNAREGQEVRFDAHALRKLQDRPWPENLVELRREVEANAMVCEGATIRGGMIEPAEGEEPRVAPADGFVPGSMKLDDHLEGLKRGWVRDALARCEGKKSAAAELLGWSPQRMNKYLKTERAKGYSF